MARAATSHSCSDMMSARIVGMKTTCRTRQISHRNVVAHSSFGDKLRSLMDFESWAPKSSKAWRLRQYSESTFNGSSNDSKNIEEDDVMESLNRRIAQQSPVTAKEEDTASVSLPSFSSMDDEDIAASLRRSITDVAVGRSVDEDTAPMTAEELRALIYNKYSKTHDVSFVRRDIPGKSIVSLNIMWPYFEQKSFPLRERAYMEKLEGVCALLDLLNSTKRVREFLKEPARARNGMPARPVVGTAVSIPLDLNQEQIEEWFGSGYL